MATKVNFRGMKLTVHAAGWKEFCKAIDMAADADFGDATIVVTDKPVAADRLENLVQLLAGNKPQTRAAKARSTRRK